MDNKTRRLEVLILLSHFDTAITDVSYFYNLLGELKLKRFCVWKKIVVLVPDDASVIDVSAFVYILLISKLHYFTTGSMQSIAIIWLCGCACISHTARYFLYMYLSPWLVPSLTTVQHRRRKDFKSGEAQCIKRFTSVICAPRAHDKSKVGGNVPLCAPWCWRLCSAVNYAFPTEPRLRIFH